MSEIPKNESSPKKVILDELNSIIGDFNLEHLAQDIEDLGADNTDAEVTTKLRDKIAAAIKKLDEYFKLATDILGKDPDTREKRTLDRAEKLLRDGGGLSALLKKIEALMPQDEVDSEGKEKDKNELFAELLAAVKRAGDVDELKAAVAETFSFMKNSSFDKDDEKPEVVTTETADDSGDKEKTTTPSDKASILPEHGLPSGFKLESDSSGMWEKYYAEVVAALGTDFFRNQVREVSDLWEAQNITKSFTHEFHEEKRYEGLYQAMKNYKSEDNLKEEEILELAHFFEMSKILFEAQATPTHSWSMTCDVDALSGMEPHGVSNELFDYFTLSEVEKSENKEKSYSYSHYVRKLVDRLVDIFYEAEDPGINPGKYDGAFRKKTGKAEVVVPAEEVPVKGKFGFSHWKDTLENKTELLKRMEYELKKDIVPDDIKLSDEKITEIAFFAHRVATMTGIRLDLFAPYMACGATPVDELGDNSPYIGEINLFAPELYSTYKSRVYLQLAEMISIPETWWTEMGKHKKTKELSRMPDIRKSFKASRLLVETMSELRELMVIPIVKEGPGKGVRIENTYKSMFDLYFDDKIRKTRRDKDVTLKAWKRGKGEFVAFKQMCFDTPGGVDVDNVPNMGKEQLVEDIIDYVNKIINKGLSYMKKNYSLAQWKDLAIMTRWAIDRCFRVYALKDESFSGATKLLKQIRARFEQANTVEKVGKVDLDGLQAIIPALKGNNMDFDGTLLKPLSSLSSTKISELIRLNDDPDNFNNDGDPPFKESSIERLRSGKNSLSLLEKQSEILKKIGIQLNPLPTNKILIKQLEDAGVILSPISKKENVVKVLDVKDFILESYPDWSLLEFDFSLGRKMPKFKIKKPVKNKQQMSIIMPTLNKMGWLVNPKKSLAFASLTNNILTKDEYKLFKQSAEKGVFGRKPEKQQENPDKK